LVGSVSGNGASVEEEASSSTSTSTTATATATASTSTSSSSSSSPSSRKLQLQQLEEYRQFRLQQQRRDRLAGGPPLGPAQASLLAQLECNTTRFLNMTIGHVIAVFFDVQGENIIVRQGNELN
jgi:hypothetical protein